MGKLLILKVKPVGSDEVRYHSFSKASVRNPAREAYAPLLTRYWNEVDNKTRLN